MTTPRQSVLISGASIAGPALAFWLHRAGFAVTVVERASTVRGGGYPIDLRGTAMDVVDRMGLGERVRAHHVDTRAMTFLDGDGERIATLRPDSVTGGTSRDVELARGDLTTLLYDAVREDVEFVFDDSVTALTEHDAGVDVTFRRGPARTFDLVVGSDGLHSTVRRLVFGPEEAFHHYLGYCFAGFTLPNDLGLSHEAVVSNVPGRAAVLYAPGDPERLFGFLNVARTDPPFDAFRDPEGQRETIAAAFAGSGWAMVPRMVAAMEEADDLFADVVSQIRMPRWSQGRVVLVGDAAFAPSFLTGQGSSLAMVGAYVLAGELAATPDHATGFAAYEERMRDFVERNQALVGDGSTSLTPKTAEALEARNRALREQSTLREDDLSAVARLELPEYRFAVAV